MSLLTTEGVILVDDLQSLEPTESYSLPSPLGKGTLILPFLLLNNYHRNRNKYLSANSDKTGRTVKPSSELIKSSLMGSIVFDDNFDFIVKGYEHKILIYANKDYIRIVETTKHKYFSSISGEWDIFKILVKRLLSL